MSYPEKPTGNYQLRDYDFAQADSKKIPMDEYLFKNGYKNAEESDTESVPDAHSQNWLFDLLHKNLKYAIGTAEENKNRIDLIPASTSSVTSESNLVLTSGGAYTNLVRRASSTTGTGSSTQPVYIKADGQVNVCNTMVDTSTAQTVAGNKTFSGTMILSKTTDASGTANNSPALILGGAVTAQHLEFDGNEIMSKANATTVGSLTLNNEGGDVIINGGVSASKVTISGGTITAPKFSGPLTGNVTGNCSGSSGSCTGNSATATKATNVNNSRTNGSLKVWTGTTAQYNAITSKDANTLYNITDDTDITLTLLQTIYPVGSLFMTTNTTCPLSALFGTWQLQSGVIDNYIIETGSNYRIWNDGYCEQWGSNNISTGTVTITFPKIFRDTNYITFKNYGSNLDSNAKDMEVSFYNKKTTSMTTSCSYGDNPNMDWIARGYLATNQYTPKVSIKTFRRTA